MEEKLQRVTLWLKKIFGSAPIPTYKANERTVDILYKLVEYNEARDKDVSLLIEDMKQKAAEYEAEANYLQGLIAEVLGLSLSSLSSEAIECLYVLVNTAMALETKDTSLTSFFGAINDMTSELYETESNNREMELELSNIRKDLTAALMLEKQLEEDLKKTIEHLEIQEAEGKRRSIYTGFLQKKYLEIKVKIMAAENQLAVTGFVQSLTHESLMSLSEKLAGLQKEIGPLKKKLESFLDLTPSPSLVQAKIEEVKRELEAVEAEFSYQVGMLTLEVPEIRRKFP
ncbi:HAUS augmin-like complex subunit 1 isoform X1 [Falco rusticolus]|uniref:HAUS augmin-like complex subunit 1 isoform X1 n=1 Tax=Falco rusticolus TaxID=120794 RepID=UPI0018865D3D|nr:HAUS augmin-like complex subunit 1 isoform X1 [Falco rusticolus]XP_055554823.1 HAUS augmin-like complex subunit 1 isoform X1 [Falco cherrug]